jgi:pyridoxine 5-phosphate synthase
MKKLGVNIDHIATLRQARLADYPDPVAAAAIAELAGADGITVHLREDRRHIQDRDVYLLRSIIQSRMNLEMTLDPEIVEIALKVVPDEVCIVPERRQEVTTEGGLDVLKDFNRLKAAVKRLHEKGIVVSIFIDPDVKQIEAAARSGAEYIELHTGDYANAATDKDRLAELSKLCEAAEFAANSGLKVNAGHGLDYFNTFEVAAIPQIETLNIGHSIVARAVLVGLDRAVRDMKDILLRATKKIITTRNIQPLSGAAFRLQVQSYRRSTDATPARP